MALIEILTFTTIASALDDLPICYDAWEEDGLGCERTEWRLNGDIRFNGADITTTNASNGINFISINCTDKFHGTDASL